MKTVLIIGIGPGDPDYLTIQAVNALNRVDVFFVLEKGKHKEKLVALRKEICARFLPGKTYRLVEATSPERNPQAPDYLAAVRDLNQEKTALFERLITQEMAEGECGAFLVWGDPTLYDSTINNIKALIETGRHALDFEVIPGISSVQALAAKHKTTITRPGRSVEITTGRRIADGLPNNVDTVVVMLDQDGNYKQYTEQELFIYWGAYVGMPEEILVAGKLRAVVADIERLRTDARNANGWIMDSYLMRLPDDQEQ
jgi:precorrin-6A synthase